MAGRSDIEQGRQPAHERSRNPPPMDPGDQAFAQRLSAVGLEDVFYEPGRFPGEMHINLGNLHRMMLHHLQREIVEEVSKIKVAGSVDGTQARRIMSALGSYGTLYVGSKIKAADL